MHDSDSGEDLGDNVTGPTVICVCKAKLFRSPWVQCGIDCHNDAQPALKGQVRSPF